MFLKVRMFVFTQLRMQMSLRLFVRLYVSSFICIHLCPISWQLPCFLPYTLRPTKGRQSPMTTDKTAQHFHRPLLLVVLFFFRFLSPSFLPTGMPPDGRLFLRLRRLRRRFFVSCVRCCLRRHLKKILRHQIFSFFQSSVHPRFFYDPSILCRSFRMAAPPLRLPPLLSSPLSSSGAHRYK